MISGDRLRQARELAGLTQRELAGLAGIPQPRLSNAERLGEGLPEAALIDIATATGFPSTFFERQPDLLIADPPHFRAQSSASAIQLKQARRAGEVVTEQALIMRSQLRPPRLELPTSSTDIRMTAAAVRASFGLSGSEPARDLPLLVERSGVLVVGVPLPAFKKDAFSFWAEDSIPVIALLATEAGDRQAWSTAHEIGHLLLHRGLTPMRNLEEEANEFAMHLLLPLDAFKDNLPEHPTLQDFALLKRHWGVSIQALIRAAKRVGTIDGDRYTSLFRQISARGERLRERVSIPALKPRGFRKMAEMLFGPSPASGLRQQADWTPAFTEEVLSRHATVSELPVRSSSNSRQILSLSERRAKRYA